MQLYKCGVDLCFSVWLQLECFSSFQSTFGLVFSYNKCHYHIESVNGSAIENQLLILFSVISSHVNSHACIIFLKVALLKMCKQCSCLCAFLFVMPCVFVVLYVNRCSYDNLYSPKINNR